MMRKVNVVCETCGKERVFVGDHGPALADLFVERHTEESGGTHSGYRLRIKGDKP